VAAAEWRNARLDFDSLPNLMRSLAASPPTSGLRLAEEATDETTLRQLAADELVSRRCGDRANLIRLWEVCQTPDFRKSTQEDHAGLVRAIFEHLTQGRRRLPEDWARAQLEALDRLDGDIETLSTRLARVRTLAYVANRADWLEDAAVWQDRARALEDRLSDTLHERLMQRFVDRRTSALIRGLEQTSGPMLGGISSDGDVTVEGHSVGRLSGLHFEPERSASQLETRALRKAIERMVTPEIARRLAEIASDDDPQFSLAVSGAILWRGEAIGEIVGGSPFAPSVRLEGDLGAATARERAVRRLETYVANTVRPAFTGLIRLRDAAQGDALTGLARGLAYQLVEAAGALPRRDAEEYLRALDRLERRALRQSGVRFGAFTIYVRDIIAPETLWIREIFAKLAAPEWRPEPGLPMLPREGAPRNALTYRGLRALGSVAAPILILERIGEYWRGADSRGVSLSPEIFAEFGWSRSETQYVMRALGFIPATKNQSGTIEYWCRRDSPAGAHASPESARPDAAGEFCRLDVWLWRARYCKTRALAAKRIANGEVAVMRGGDSMVVDKPSRSVRRDDILTFEFGGRRTKLRVLAIGERRGPAVEARALYALLPDASSCLGASNSA